VLRPNSVLGQDVLLTAGATSGAIGRIRVITNRSSGKMGYAIARAAALAGAQVTMVSGPVALPTPYGVQRINVQSAREMHAAVMAQADHADDFIGVAAVADWYVKNAASQKLTKDEHAGVTYLQFAENPEL